MNARMPAPVSMITVRAKCAAAEATVSLYGMSTLYGFSPMPDSVVGAWAMALAVPPL
jgi:hypothetical protein